MQTRETQIFRVVLRITKKSHIQNTTSTPKVRQTVDREFQCFVLKYSPSCVKQLQYYYNMSNRRVHTSPGDARVTPVRLLLYLSLRVKTGKRELGP